jgi:hypothetical protein
MTGEVVTDPWDIAEASSAPRIDSVAELGGGDVLLTSDVKAQPGDGVATVGEALWVRGSSFGRRPTVTVAGRPAAILTRTTDGGLVVRVPPAVLVGPQPLTVINDRGHGDFVLTVRRLVAALPPGGGQMAVADLSAEGLRTAVAVPVAGQLLRVGADGRAAYTLDVASARLTVFELPAQGGPRQVFTLDLDAKRGGDPVIAFAAAGQAPALMVLRQLEVWLLDATAPLRPARSQPRPLPPEVHKAGPVVAALSPDGKMAAVALEDGNRIALIDLSKPGLASLLAELPLAPEARVPVVVDVAFAPDGRTLWVALGDTAKSRAVGPQPTEIAAVRIQPAATPDGRPVLAIARRVRIDEAEAPVRLNTGRAMPLASGASIRLPPERATVYLTAANHAGVTTVFRLGAEDRATAFLETPGRAGAADLSPDGRWLLVPVVQASGRLAIVAAPADDHPGARQSFDLGLAGPPGGPPGAPLPSVAAQP